MRPGVHQKLEKKLREPDDVSSNQNERKELPRLKPRLEKVATTQGAFFTRNMLIRDLKYFNAYLDSDTKKEEMELKALGELALKVLVSAEEKSPQACVLTDAVYSKFTAEDINKLAVSVAKMCDITSLQPDNPLESLGSELFDKLSVITKSQAASLKSIQELVGKNFGSLSSPLQGAIGEHLRKINSISESLRASPAMEAFRKMQEENTETLRKYSESSVVKEARGLGSKIGTKIPSQLIEPPTLPVIDLESPLTRSASASEAATQQLREVVGYTGQLTEQLGSLQTLFLTQVFPEWKASLQDNTDNANRSLKYAVRALWVSVGVAVVTTAIQLLISHQYKMENDAQQLENQLIWQQQLEAIKSISGGDSTDIPSERYQEGQWLKAGSSL